MADAYVPGAVGPLDDEQASREVAEENLVREVVERMERTWAGSGMWFPRLGKRFGFSFSNPSTLSIPILQRACWMFYQKRRGTLVAPRFLIGANGIELEFH